MIHLTFQIVNALITLAIAGVYYLLSKHNQKRCRELESEIKVMNRAVDCAEERLKFMSKEFQRSSMECAEAKDELVRLRGQLMVKMGAGQN